MKIDHIETFLEVAASGNFNRAAETLNVTQSTVSARIKAIEDLLGRPLLERRTGGAVLTPAGQQFLRYATTIRRSWRQGREEVAVPEGFRGVLGLGTQISLWERLVIRWVSGMRQRLPDVALKISAGYSDALMRQLGDGLLDIGVMYQPRNTSGLEVEMLLEEELLLFSTRPRRVTDDWLADYVYIDWGEAFLADHRDAFPDLPLPSLTVNLGAMGLQHILRHGGSGYFPLRLVRPLVEEGRLHAVAQAPVFTRPAYVVYPTEPLQPETVKSALAELRDVAAMESGG